MKPEPKLDSLNADQKRALESLEGDSNVFLTGAAGSGKSFLIKKYLKGKTTPVLASTGAAAILVGGRTFHSFFGLGIVEGGAQKTIERALNNKRLLKRLKTTSEVVIDEVSMISGPVLGLAETIARKVRGNDSPWGGMRVIVVGDFAQLPPVNPFSQQKEWAFLSEAWERSEFLPAVLTEPMRSKDTEFLEILNEIRKGRCSSEVISFLNSRLLENNPKRKDTVMTCLFSLRAQVEKFNLERLKEIHDPIRIYKTSYIGKEKDIENFKKHSPLQDIIQLKEGALVMLRQNDPEGRWVNGTTGWVESITDDALGIRLNSGVRQDEILSVPIAEFTLLNAEGEPVVTAKNFPVTLAWAMTIHKAQGTSLDPVKMDLRRIWEPGQAYVALSRAKKSKNLFLEGWDPNGIKVDRLVSEFHRELGL